MIRNALILAGCFGMGLSQDGDSDVIVNGIVPQATQGAIPLNKVIDAVVGVVNEGSEAINVTSVAGSLTSPYDSNYFYQNVRFFFSFPDERHRSYTIHTVHGAKIQCYGVRR